MFFVFIHVSLFRGYLIPHTPWHFRNQGYFCSCPLQLSGFKRVFLAGWARPDQTVISYSIMFYTSSLAFLRKKRRIQCFLGFCVYVIASLQGYFLPVCIKHLLHLALFFYHRYETSVQPVVAANNRAGQKDGQHWAGSANGQRAFLQHRGWGRTTRWAITRGRLAFYALQTKKGEEATKLHIVWCVQHTAEFSCTGPDSLQWQIPPKETQASQQWQDTKQRR